MRVWCLFGTEVAAKDGRANVLFRGNVLATARSIGWGDAIGFVVGGELFSPWTFDMEVMLEL